MEIVTRDEAVARGLLWYFTGVACPHGHVAKRSVSNRECRGCVNARHRRKRVADTERYRARDKRRREANIDLFRARMRAQYVKHREKRVAADRARYPREAAARKRRAREWQRRNPGVFRYMVARRRAYIRQATPRWLTREQRRQIRAFYVEAAARPGDWHVDHIVPLRGREVCGLNVPWNLQIIAADANRRKGNRLIGS